MIRKKTLILGAAWALAGGLALTGCGGQEPAPAPAPPPKAPAPKVAHEVAFAVPILDGKVDAWKSFLADATGKRKAEWDEARAASGLTRERVWLQNTPNGALAVVYQEAEDVSKVMSHFASSEMPMDQDFMKMLQDVHGMDPMQPMEPNSVFVHYDGDGTRNPAYGFVVPIVEGQEATVKEMSTALNGPKAADFAASRERVGLTREKVWLQGGKMWVVVHESAEMDQVMPNWIASEDPFDVWLLDEIQKVSGVDMRAAKMEKNALMLDWTAPAPEPEAAPEGGEGPAEEMTE